MHNNDVGLLSLISTLLFLIRVYFVQHYQSKRRSVNNIARENVNANLVSCEKWIAELGRVHCRPVDTGRRNLCPDCMHSAPQLAAISHVRRPKTCVFCCGNACIRSSQLPTQLKLCRSTVLLKRKFKTNIAVHLILRSIWEQHWTVWCVLNQLVGDAIQITVVICNSSNGIF